MKERSAVLERFVALDLETTGFDFVKDDIIEVGAARVEGSRIVGTYEEYVFTEKTIPYRVKQLTGITEDDLVGSASVSEVLKKLEGFVEDLPVIAHHAPFDLGFLKAKGYEPAGAVHDTLTIARIVLPRARDHRLGTLLEGFGIDPGVSHRACSDAIGVAKLFLALSQELANFGPTLLERINRIVSGCKWAEEDIFRTALKLALKSSLLDHKTGFSDRFTYKSKNIFGKEKIKPALNEKGIHRDRVRQFFAEDGELARSLADFESRPEQLSMAEACARAFNEDGFLVVEAGTGTGKSMAYLFPSVLWSLACGERVIVSTNTKNLQDQLFYQDIPVLSGAIERDFKATLLKGRGNYLCRTKWETVTSAPSSNLSRGERIGILPLLVWLEQTETGEFSECTGFKARDFPGIHNAICCEWNYCLGEKCTFRKGCYLSRVRDAAQDSHLVVVNHALILSDLVAKSRAVGDYGRLILDEAHNLEDAATEHMGRRVSFVRIRGILDVVSPERGYGGGLLGAIERRAKKTSEALSKSLGGIKKATQETRVLARRFFDTLLEMMKSNADWGRRRYTEGDDRIGAVVPDGVELAQRLDQLKDSLAGISAWLGSREEGEEWIEILKSLSAREVDILETSADLKFLLSADDTDHCYWTEIRGRDEDQRIEMRSAPIDVGRSLRETLYEKLDSCVFTSAALTVATSFDFFESRVGLFDFSRERVRTLYLGSPFDFSEQTLVVLARYLPSPQSAGFTRAAAKLIERVLLGTRRGTLVLLTSYAMLNDLVTRLSRKLQEAGITALIQGESGSRTRILEEFKADVSSVVFGTDSFWEGVDVPGEPLQMLVITKLPFPVPNEPIIQARTETLERQSLDAFSSYMLPRAVIRFRQGFGRLIRNRTDRGVVIIADPRLGTASYGDVFMSSIPREVELCSTEQEVMDRIEKFWEDEE